MSDDLNKLGQDAKALAVAWYAHPVPLWALGVAFLVGAVVAAMVR